MSSFRGQPQIPRATSASPVLSENLDLSVVFDPCDKESSLIRNAFELGKIIVALIEGIDAVWNNGDILFRSSNVQHFAVTHYYKTGKIAIQVQFGMQFDCAFVLSVVRPIILIQTEVDRNAVDGMKWIMEVRNLCRRTFRDSGKNLLEQFPEHIRIPSVHGIGERRFHHSSHSEVIKPIMIRYQSLFNFTQRILSSDLCIKTSQELLPCRKRLAIMVPGQVFYGFFKTISGNEVEKLLKDTIVIHCRVSYAQIKDFRLL